MVSKERRTCSEYFRSSDSISTKFGIQSEINGDFVVLGELPENLYSGRADYRKQRAGWDGKAINIVRGRILLNPE